jgi:uncharacterized phage protein gp47/JayE
MAFARPTLAEIRARIQADLNERANSGTPYLRRAFEYVLSWALAAVVHDLHGHIAYGVQQMLPTTCDEVQLAQWGQMLSVPRKQPTAATGNYVFSGTNTTVIPAGTVIQVTGNVRYETTAEGTISAGTATVAVEAQEVGEEGNTDAATPGALVSPISGIQTAGVFDGSGATGGTDLEELETWRTRVLVRLSTTPRGGTSADYEVWARETPGVDIREVFVTPLRSGAGTVDVAFTVEIDDAVDDPSDQIPSAPQVALVQAYIDTKRPADMAGCEVYAPTEQTQNYTIAIRPNTSTIRAAVEASIRAMHVREVPMGATLLLSKIGEAISASAGEIDHEVTVPATNITATSDDHIILSGTFTFSTLPEA